MIAKNSTWPICALRESVFSDVKMPYQFLIDLADALPITHQSIAEDLLCDVTTRETITRAAHKPDGCMGAALSFAVLHLLITRPPEFVQVKVNARNSVSREYTAEMHKAVLALIESYGVTCASGKCCGAVKEIVKERVFA